MADSDEFDCEFDAVDDLALLQALDQVENKLQHTSGTMVAGSIKVFAPQLQQRVPLDAHQPSMNINHSSTALHPYPDLNSVKEPSSFAPLTVVAGRQKQQTSIFDHFKSTHLKHSGPSQNGVVKINTDVDVKNANQGQKQSLLSLEKHPQTKPKAHNPKRPDAVPSYHSTDEEALKTWVYPINYPIRDYQFNIAQSALFSNTLVCLPTGLGKTFIAAVVIYNYLRWFPQVLLYKGNGSLNSSRDALCLLLQPNHL